MNENEDFKIEKIKELIKKIDPNDKVFHKTKEVFNALDEEDNKNSALQTNNVDINKR